MAICVDANQGRWGETFWAFVGWVFWGVAVGVILFPALYVVVVYDPSGELGGLVVIWGLGLSTWQGAVWTAIWFGQGRVDASKRRMMFGIGVPLCLTGSLGALFAARNIAAPTERLASAGVAYIGIAALAVWASRQPATDRSMAE